MCDRTKQETIAIQLRNWTGYTSRRNKEAIIGTDMEPTLQQGQKKAQKHLEEELRASDEENGTNGGNISSMACIPKGMS